MIKVKRYLIISIITLAVVLMSARVFAYPADVEDISGEKYFAAVKEELASAKESIKVVMFVIEVPSNESNAKSQQLVDELINAHKRGVDVEVILDQNIDYLQENGRKLQEKIKSLEAYKQLKEAGIKVYYDDFSRYTHAKTVIIDDQIVILGSTNWTSSALSRSVEASVLIKSEELANSLLEYFKTIKKDTAIDKYVEQAQAGLPIKIEFMKDTRFAPKMMKQHDERAFDVYLFLLHEYDGNSEARITLFYDTVAEYLGMDTMNTTAYRRQIIKVLRKLESKYRLITFEPRYAKEATITLLDYNASEDKFFELPEEYFTYGWGRKLSFRAKFCYFINIISAGESDKKPFWSKSVANITAEFGNISEHIIFKGMDELRRKKLVEVAYDSLTDNPYDERAPKLYKVLELYDVELLEGKLKDIEAKYGEKEYKTAKNYAKIVFEENNPEGIEDIILKTAQYGKERIKKAFAIVAQKNKDNPKRKYSYVTGILENWGQNE